MARFVSHSKTLLRHGNASQTAKGVKVSHRHRSSEAKWVEIDDVKLLEEHHHRITVKKATPDWLPFLPGSSFWVPPPPSPFLHKFSISSSQLFFIQSSESNNQFGNSNATPRGMRVTVQLNLLTLPENLDDEG
ncbi:uncharacterized protein LOC113846544 [Abrus precatorius]|uniref:Uncharacterized protein LOC113846544 n=1 Tax=Abrus precatorius TaxID=3816 RepID=A0A8B8JH95_ABRPR|nr:uncharacterized protein LOC113846544 [Abrus precatorius]